MTDEVLPHTAYEYMKKNFEKKVYPTDIKYIFSYESDAGECTIFNITNGDVICRFNVEQGHNFYDVTAKNDQWIILSGDASKKINVLNCNGEIINQFDLLEKASYLYKYFIDESKDQIYFFRYERMSKSEQWNNGFLDIIRWNYVTNEVIKVKHELSF